MSDYIPLEIRDYTVMESVGRDGDVSSKVVFQLVLGEEDMQLVEYKSESGPVDALFHGAKAQLAGRFASLENIMFEDFILAANSENQDESRRQGSDAKAEVQLAIRNTCRNTFEFVASSVSMLAASVEVVCMALEHFVNAQRAVTRVMDWIEDAQRRNRPSLVETYIDKLTLLVQNASYEKVLAERKKRLTGN